MYHEAFFLKWKLWNNAFVWNQRKKHEADPKLYVPKCVKWTLADVKVWKNYSFAELNDQNEVQYFLWLESFVVLVFGNKKTIVVDNHNHALFFWYEALKVWIIDEQSLLIHIDQHSDMNKPERSFEQRQQSQNSSYSKLQQVFYYTNEVCNVWNFILPAKELKIIDKIERIKSEQQLLDWNVKNVSNKKTIILDIDLDFWAPEMGIEQEQKTFEIVKKLCQKADLITIATSPYFLDQETALELIKNMFR